jgi:hypothetical protein
MKKYLKLTDVKYAKEEKYLRKQRKKKNIFAILETDNKYDENAIAIYTTKQDKTKVKIGYLRKYDYIFIYEDNGAEEYEPEYYERELLEVKKEAIYTDEELFKILDDINNDNYYYNYTACHNESYLILNGIEL